MSQYFHPVRAALVVALVALAAAGCSRKTPTEPWPPLTDPRVFDESFAPKVGFQAFGGSKLDALDIDSTTAHTGRVSLKVTVPNPNDPTGGYAGGAFVAALSHELSGYNALSFWVKASRATNLDVAGLGNDNTGTSKFDAARKTIPMTTSWTQVLVPIPDPSKLTDEKGMFYFAEGPQAGSGLTLWLDDITFVNTAQVTNPRPALTTQTASAIVGGSLNLAGLTKTVYTITGFDQTVTHMPGYFSFTSSNYAVATPAGSLVQVLSAGTAAITAKLGAIAATGTLTVNATAPPATPAPTPTVPAAQVISIFSNAYTNIPVDTWSATWDQADVSDLTIAGNATKLYTNLNYAGIEFTSHVIDATSMSAFHVDVWATAGTLFRVKLVDFGANGTFGGGDDTESELTFNAASTPPFSSGGWVPLDIPLANFTTLLHRAHVAQVVLSSTDAKTVFVDNLYFHQ